jgi:putative endonuclease
LPVRLVYRERAADRSAALTREMAIKRLPRASKIALLDRARRARRARPR